jgi:hypothetical protein
MIALPALSYNCFKTKKNEAGNPASFLSCDKSEFLPTLSPLSPLEISTLFIA